MRLFYLISLKSQLIFIPLAIGWLGDHVGLRDAMFLILVLLAYIISISFWARPLARNETLFNREAPKTA